MILATLQRAAQAYPSPRHFMAAKFPYKHPRYAWQYVVFLYALSKQSSTQLPLTAKEVSLASLRSRLFQGRKYLEDGGDDCIKDFVQPALCTKIKALTASQLEIVGDDSFEQSFSSVKSHFFIKTLSDIDDFFTSSKTSFAAADPTMSCFAWEAIGFYVARKYPTLSVKQTYQTSIYLRK